MQKSQSPYVRPVVWTRENDVPVKMYGYTPIYQAPPTINDEHIMQRGNSNAPEKISLKTSSEIKSNYIGVCTTRMPTIPEHDYQSLQPVNLIDGNPETCWASRFRLRPDAEPVWIRLDFSKESTITKVVIKKRPITFDRNAYQGSTKCPSYAEEAGRAMAKSIHIKAAPDAYTWKTLFDGIIEDRTPEEFTFEVEPFRAKQLVLEANDFPACEIWCYAFSVASIEVYNEKGENIALFSKGATVSTNSTGHNSHNERAVSMWNWQLQMDLGLKWARIGYHDDPINWHWVEQEKGVLKMDEMAEDAIDILAENNIDIVYCLDFGNRLYEGYKERKLPQLPEWYYETPYPPTSEEAFRGWENFVRFSVNYYKDRVKYFEIWNEWNGINYWGDTPNADDYIKLAKRTIPIIRECAPECKVALGSFAQFVHEETPENCDWNTAMFYKAIDELAPYVDVIGYHPFYQPTLDGNRYLEYTDNIKRFKKYCEEKGFKGNEYMASEFAVGAMYPPTLPGTPSCWWGKNGAINFSEIEKAKVLAQLLIKHSALGIQSMICELSNAGHPLELSLLKRSTDSYPVLMTNATMAYYVIRNMSTVLDEYEPAEYAVNCSDIGIKEIYTMEKPGVRAVTLWTSKTVCDDCDGAEVDLMVDFEAKSAAVINFINGERTKLDVEVLDGKTYLKGIIVRDCPNFIELYI